jgi:ATPase subunit of ABC transporter with duplicated ATPase domains
MGHIELAHVHHDLPDGRVLLDDVSFRVANGSKTALIGANGAGKTTLVRLVAGQAQPKAGTVTTSGGLGVMPQFVGHVRDGSTVRDLLLSAASGRVRTVATALASAEELLASQPDERAQMRYAHALGDWGEAGGYDAEVVWDACCTEALGVPFTRAERREVRSLSGGEQKRLVLEALLRGPDEVVLLDEPDNFLDVSGKRWLEERLSETPKTVLFVSHDRELLARVADRIVTVEGGGCWVHGGGFATYHEARAERLSRLEEMTRRWEEERARLTAWVATLREQARMSDAMASRYRAAQTRLRHFEEAGPPEAPPPRQKVAMRLSGGRTGVRAVMCEGLELTGLMSPFSTEIFYGERVAVVGSNGSGKSHFLRLLANGGTEGQEVGAQRQRGGGGLKVAPVAHEGSCRLGARVVPGYFAQSYDHPELEDKAVIEIIRERHALDIGGAMAVLRRYELDRQAAQPFETLSGGQKARLQILLLELSGATLLLLDEPTDNLDLVSAEALEDGLSHYQGTVIAVTHDRWFARSFDRFLVFADDCSVHDALAPDWDNRRVKRAR